MPYVDLAFKLTGSTVPVDHGYALYSAISRILPEIHGAKNMGVHPIRGTYSGNGELMLRDSSRLVIRLESERIGEFLKLAGKRLEIDSHTLRVGIPEVRLLLPRASLYSRLVTIKGFMGPGTFLESAKRQLEKLGGEAEIQVGERRTLRVKDKQVVGFELAALDLNAEDSFGDKSRIWGHHGFGVRHNNDYSLDIYLRFLLILQSWPAVPESSQPVCSITSLSAATNGERRFVAMTTTKRTSSD